MFQFNYSVFDMFRTSKCSSSIYGISFLHPYKQYNDQITYMDAGKKYH